MRIKVTRASESHYWYAWHIGEEYEVYGDVREDEFGKCYQTKDNSDMNNSGTIGVEDCEVVES